MLTFLHISDTHISSDLAYHPVWLPDSIGHPNCGFAALQAAVARLPFSFDFILHTGDVSADPRTGDYHCARELLLQLPAPIYCLPGNHDSAEHMGAILHDGQHLHFLDDAHLQLGDYHLLTLDTNKIGSYSDDAHSSRLSEAQIVWFAERLAAIAPAPYIVAAHHPLIETGVPWIDERMRVQNGERIHQLLCQHRANLTAVFHGHIHQAITTQRDGIMYISCQSTWSNLAAYPGLHDDEADPLTVGGFNLVMLHGTRVFTRRYSLPLLQP